MFVILSEIIKIALTIKDKVTTVTMHILAVHRQGLKIKRKYK